MQLHFNVFFFSIAVFSFTFLDFKVAQVLSRLTVNWRSRTSSHLFISSVMLTGYLCPVLEIFSMASFLSWLGSRIWDTERTSTAGSSLAVCSDALMLDVFAVSINTKLEGFIFFQKEIIVFFWCFCTATCSHSLIFPQNSFSTSSLFLIVS